MVGEGARSTTFGSLILGYYEDGLLRYAGRAWSGFDTRTLADLSEILAGRETKEYPFAADPELEEGDNRWVTPDLVASVKFAEWTQEDRLRAPVFLGLRPDIDPTDVGREEAKLEASPAQAKRESVPAVERDRDDISGVLEQLSEKVDKLLLEVDSYEVALINLDKPLWPAENDRGPITKWDMLRYYVGMGPHVLCHVRDRLLTLTLYPNEIYRQSFYQKRFEQELPEFAETVRLFSSHNEGDVEYVMINHLATLVWLAQLADIELHPWQSRVVAEPDALGLPTTFTGSEDEIKESALNYPDVIVFDLDPYIYSGDEKEWDEPELNRRAFSKAAEVAVALKDILDQLSLSSFLKTSGKTGLHIYVPVGRQYDYGTARNLRDRGPRPHAAHALGRNDGVVGRQAQGKDLPGSQPECPGEEHGLDLLDSAAARGYCFDPAPVGRTGEGLSHRLQHRHGAGSGCRDRRSVVWCDRGEA
jgi:bifunctional non-homologous end joining protein LigD